MPRTPRGQRADYVFFDQLPTRWMDNDQYGHMNNVIHYSLIDTVVTNWQIQQGLFDESDISTHGPRAAVPCVGDRIAAKRRDHSLCRRFFFAGLCRRHYQPLHCFKPSVQISPRNAHNNIRLGGITHHTSALAQGDFGFKKSRIN